MFGKLCPHPLVMIHWLYTCYHHCPLYTCYLFMIHCTSIHTSIQVGPQLISLKLTGARITDCDTFRDMVCRFENMRHLSLSGTFFVKSDEMNALAMAGTPLQEVSRGAF